MMPMLRKLILFAFLLGLAQSASAVPALVRLCPASATLNGGNNGSVTTVTCVFASNAAGDMLGILGFTDTTSVTLSISDGAGNTWTPAQSNLSSGTNKVSLWYTCNANASAGSNIVTVTFSGTVTQAWTGGGEYSGLATSNCLDQTTFANISGQTAWSSGNVTTTVASELFLGVAAGGDGSATLSAGTNVAWAIQQKTTNGNKSPGWQHFIASSTQTLDAQFTYSTAQGGVCIIATFKTPAAAGSGAVKKKKYVFLALPMVEPILY